MSLIYRLNDNSPGFMQAIYDYLGEIGEFVKRVKNPFLVAPMIFLKSIEWSIYRWYKTPVSRFYGIKSNELIYMITSRCNERCPKCGIWKNPESNDCHLEIQYFINCLNRLHRNLYQVTLTGGEPLLFKNDVIRIAEEARKLNIVLVTITNGRLIDKIFLEKYKELRHILVVSADSVEKEKWNEFRGRTNFERVMSNIILAKDILGDKLRIQSVLSKESAAEVPKVIEFCKQHGIQHNIQLYQDFGGHWTHLPDEAHSYDKALPCAARKNICVYPNGDIVKCFDHKKISIAKQPLGNIAQKDIIEILCSTRSRNISKAMKNCNFSCKNMACNKPQIDLFQ